MADYWITAFFLAGITAVSIVLVVYNFMGNNVRYKVLGKMIEKDCKPETIREVFYAVTPYSRLLITGIVIAGLGVGLILTGVADSIGLIDPPGIRSVPNPGVDSAAIPIRIDFGSYGPGFVFLALGLAIIVARYLSRNGIHKGEDRELLP